MATKYPTSVNPGVSYQPDPTVNGPWTHTRPDIPLFRNMPTAGPPAITPGGNVPGAGGNVAGGAGGRGQGRLAGNRDFMQASLNNTLKDMMATGSRPGTQQFAQTPAFSNGGMQAGPGNHTPAPPMPSTPPAPPAPPLGGGLPPFPGTGQPPPLGGGLPPMPGGAPQPMRPRPSPLAAPSMPAPAGYTTKNTGMQQDPQAIRNRVAAALSSGDFRYR